MYTEKLINDLEIYENCRELSILKSKIEDLEIYLNAYLPKLKVKK